MARFKHITVEESKNYRKLHAGIDYSENDMSRVTCFTREKDPDSRFDIVNYYGDINIGLANNDAIEGKVQFIYILSNPSIPGVYKIGHTTRTVFERVKEINAAPGVMVDWEPRWSYACYNSGDLEKEIHSYLQNEGLRLNKKREGFVVDLNYAIEIIEKLGKKYQPR